MKVWMTAFVAALSVWAATGAATAADAQQCPLITQSVVLIRPAQPAFRCLAESGPKAKLVACDGCSTGSRRFGTHPSCSQAAATVEVAARMVRNDKGQCILPHAGYTPATAAARAPAAPKPVAAAPAPAPAPRVAPPAFSPAGAPAASRPMPAFQPAMMRAPEPPAVRPGAATSASGQIPH